MAAGQALLRLPFAPLLAAVRAASSFRKQAARPSRSAACLLFLCFVLASCGQSQRGAADPDARSEIAATGTPEIRPSLFPLNAPQGRITTLRYLLPGALSTSAMFGPLREPPDRRGTLVMEYRFPGMQGQPLHPPMRIAAVAEEIARHAAAYPQAEIEMIAFSTGGALAIEAAGRIGPERRVTLVILSSVTPKPGAQLSALRGGWALLHSALKIGSLSPREVWGEYYKVLLYGYGWREREDLRRKAERLAKRDKKHLVVPRKGLGRAQTKDLLGWQLSEAAGTSAARVLFLHGALDPVFAPRRVAVLAAQLKARLCLVRDGGHMLLTTHPDLVKEIEAFLEGRLDRRNCGGLAP